MRHITLLLVLIFCAITSKAQDFNKLFSDSTLRITYTFSGNAHKQNIALDQLTMSPHWFGKRQNLSKIPVEGNAQIAVRLHNTKQLIYLNSFSTLFQEWITYDEALKVDRSFENVLLIPMPKEAVDVEVYMINNRREKTVSFTHTITPNDILIRQDGFKDLTPFETIHQAADTSKCIRIAYLAEGYTESEMPAFINDAKRATEALFAHEPFKELQSKFNIIAVKSPSKESGTSIPSKGIWKETALQSSFDTFYSDRYLTTLHVKKIHQWLAGLPYEHIIILVNTSEYGGGGILNFYNLSSCNHKSFLPVVVHEFGHSFAGLADEYAYEQEQLNMYPLDIEPWEPNITTLVQFDKKWKNLLDPKTPIPTPLNNKKYTLGAFEGAGYSLKGVYRGERNCRMRANDIPNFCTVCRKALTDVINFYTK